MRIAEINRQTKETDIKAFINLDGKGLLESKTGISFLEHMLDQICKHGLIDIKIECIGDRHIDDHHSIEDIGISLGQAFQKAIGDKRGIQRYGYAYVPLDESLSRVVVDFSGRPGLFFNVNFTRSKVGRFDVDLIKEFLQGFVNHANVTLHVDNLKPGNTHHQCETIFKALGLALRSALKKDIQNMNTIPSTKGVL